MDEFPAVPPGSVPRSRPLSLSVVIPVHNGGADFDVCLRRLQASEGAGFELIVVDDGSTDGSSQWARDHGAKVIRFDQASGPAAARNAGAKAASGDVVFFLDADVAVYPDTLRLAVERFERDADLCALFGSYDDAPPAPGAVSRYRNLLHHYVHQQGHFEDDARPAHTFWTGCGAIRRELFLTHGGFDRERYRRPAIEDIELGYRIHRSGGKILLVRNILATHLKRWSFRQVIRTDILCRGVPWMLLLKRMHQAETDLNVSADQRLSVVATGVGALCLVASPIAPVVSLGWLGSLALIATLNRRFYGFLKQKQGNLFALQGFMLHYLYFWCCGLSVVIALVLWHLKLRHERGVGLPGVRLDVAEPSAVPGPESTRGLWRRPRWKSSSVRSSPSSSPTADEPGSPRR